MFGAKMCLLVVFRTKKYRSHSASMVVQDIGLANTWWTFRVAQLFQKWNGENSTPKNGIDLQILL